MDAEARRRAAAAERRWRNCRRATRRWQRGLGGRDPAAARRIAGGFTTRRLPLRERASRPRARHACLAHRLVPLHPLQERRGGKAQASRPARGCRPGSRACTCGGRHARSRSHQHPCQRFRACRARGGRARARQCPWRVGEGDGRLWPACRQLPHDPRRGAGERPAAAAHRSPLGFGARAQGHHHRQGHLLRYRRPRHQARQRHGADEEGHGGAPPPRSPSLRW